MRSITVEELKARIDAGEKLHLIDVREPWESAEFNIGGQSLPIGKIQLAQIDTIENLKNEEMIVYCRSGTRSSSACLFLETLGFTDPVNVTGGLLAWQEKFNSR